MTWHFTAGKGYYGRTPAGTGPHHLLVKNTHPLPLGVQLHGKVLPSAVIKLQVDRNTAFFGDTITLPQRIMVR